MMLRFHQCSAGITSISEAASLTKIQFSDGCVLWGIEFQNELPIDCVNSDQKFLASHLKSLQNPIMIMAL